ncbi:hypothetical protein BRADI_3g47362v3 [Brachypodium distachyon]|uniref:Serine/threonine specific protein phosphatases domain-containing protein n=1 Tax=Brachypodium distachyon TaxID=15368 RepID=A0A2K2D3U4_BRADI|nr:hypothetical protein BRADI_3g47362v3 [Brachypodium distachyon]
MRWLTSSARGRHALAAQASSVDRPSPSKRTAHASASSALASAPPTVGAAAGAPPLPSSAATTTASALSSTTRAADLLPLRRRHRRPCRTSDTTSPHMQSIGHLLVRGNHEALSLNPRRIAAVYMEG